MVAKPIVVASTRSDDRFQPRRRNDSPIRASASAAQIDQGTLSCDRIVSVFHRWQRKERERNCRPHPEQAITGDDNRRNLWRTWAINRTNEAAQTKGPAERAVRTGQGQWRPGECLGQECRHVFPPWLARKRTCALRSVQTIAHMHCPECQCSAAMAYDHQQRPGRRRGRGPRGHPAGKHRRRET